MKQEAFSALLYIVRHVKSSSFRLKKVLEEKNSVMKVLNVAEKNDAAKNIAIQLSRNAFTRREGKSKFNKIYEFNYNVWNRNCKMIMTSVSGHLLTYEFYQSHRSWQSCQPNALFDAPVKKGCSEDFRNIKETLEREVRSCDALIIWTDCDREGENIGFEIIQVCKEIKPNIPVYRAKFSEITYQSVTRALNNLADPDKAISDAVDVRSELDLRIGAAFTRFQTLRLQRVFPRNLADMLISYGSCQFPTLGFVVERFLAIERFKPEPFWKIRVLDERDNLSVEFRWARYRLFEKLPCQVLLDVCLEDPQARVEKIVSKPKTKWRPLPLDTIELEKQGSRKLRLNAKETMRIAEKLYTGGYISYPRTETNIFPKDLNLTALVGQQTEDNNWGQFAQGVLNDGVNPRQGKKSDQAHPPIHPTKYANNLQGNEARVYEFVVRHFLACVSKDAQGHETIVDIDIAGEKFTATGLQILAKNYLDVYIYDKWNAKEIHLYEQGQTFNPTSIEMTEEKTTAPNLLTEADLIALMDKHGIGTDATHAEHIETIKSRHYVGVKDNKYLIPGKLGIGLVMGYDRMGFEMSMSKPNLRAELENDLKLICESRKDPKEVLQAQVAKYREVFREASVKANLIDQALAEWLDEGPAAVEAVGPEAPVEQIAVFKCPKCDSDMILRTRAEQNTKYIGCSRFPDCKNAIWFPEGVKEMEVLNEICDKCTGSFKRIKLKFAPNAYPVFGTSYVTCVGGCDRFFNEAFSITRNKVQKVQNATDSGFLSGPSYNSGRSQASSNNSNNRPASSVSNSPTNRTTHPSFVDSTNNSWNNSDRNRATPRNNNSSNLNTSFGGNFNWVNENRDDSDIVCNCHLPAKKLTVRKEGPNLGRQFYKCPNNIGADCSFFLWASDQQDHSNSTTSRNNTNCSNTGQSHQQRYQSNSTTPRNNTNSSNISQSYPQSYQSNSNDHGGNRGNSSNSWGDSGDRTMCKCNLEAKKLTVNKEGSNKGRKFYACPKGINQGCNFFLWANDDEAGNSNNSENWGPPPPPPGRGRGRGRGGSNTSKSSGSGGQRKCGNCGIPGHTRKTCSQNR